MILIINYNYIYYNIRAPDLSTSFAPSVGDFSPLLPRIAFFFLDNPSALVYNSV